MRAGVFKTLMLMSALCSISLASHAALLAFCALRMWRPALDIIFPASLASVHPGHSISASPVAL
jgi:hypothetical protein